MPSKSQNSSNETSNEVKRKGFCREYCQALKVTGNRDYKVLPVSVDVQVGKCIYVF